MATIAICLGANLAIFAVINSILFRPLPFPNSDRLVSIYNTYPKAGVENDGSSITNYYERRGTFRRSRVFRFTAKAARSSAKAVRPNRSKCCAFRRIFSRRSACSLAMGRAFTEEEAAIATATAPCILTDAYWRQRFNADPNVLGRDLRVNTMPRKIVGVLPPDFRFLSSEAQLVLPDQHDAGATHAERNATRAAAART